MMWRTYAFVCIVSVLASVASAQTTVGASIPEGSALMISHSAVSFDLSRVAFPPPSFPWYFDPTEPAEAIELQLYSNIEGGWALTASFAGLVSEAGDLLLPSQVEYRLDGAGAWHPLGLAVTLLSGFGTSSEYSRHLIEFRLLIVGNEIPGSYEGTLVFSIAKP